MDYFFENVQGTCCKDDHLDENVDPKSQRYSPVPSVISMKTDQSMDHPVTFTGGSKQSTSEQAPEFGGVLCAVCPKKALKSCLTCVASYCELHVRQHYTAPALQRHRLEEAEAALEQKLCQRHGRELEFYCNTDLTASLQMIKSEMENKTAVPPPGPIEFTSVNPDSVCLCWGPPEGLTGAHRFRVSWTGEGSQENLEVEDLQLHVQGLTPGEKYTFTVATLSDDGRKSPCVSATTHTDIPPPDDFTVDMDLTSLSLTWSDPEGVDQASYLLTLKSDDGKTLQTVSTKTPQHSFKALPMGKKHSITLFTVVKGFQRKSITKTFRTKIPVPKNVTVGSVSLTSADLSWSLHQGMEQIPHSFLISYHSEGAEPQTISTESCSTTLTDLQPDTQYTVSVCCLLRDGTRSQATSIIIQTGSLVPESLTVDALDREFYEWKVNLSWTMHQAMEQIPHSFLISYHSEEAEPQTISTESCSITLKHLQPDIQYTVSVCCKLRDREMQSESVLTTFHTGERRIVLLGKTGDGKSSAGNTILGKKVFAVHASQYSVTSQCETHSRIINGRKYIITDTPGFFDTALPVESLKRDITKCIFDSSPGPHAFIIVLKVGRYTKHEEQIIHKIKELFAEDTFKHALVLFTHGGGLDGQSIKEFVEENRSSPGAAEKRTTLKDLVDACHGRCHVIDNKEWRHQEEGENSNRAQVANLFDTIEEVVRENNGGYYINEMLVLVEEAILVEMQILRDKQRDQEQQLSDLEIKEKAKETLKWRILLNKAVATVPVMLLGFFCSPALPVRKILSKVAIKKAAAQAKHPGDAIVEALQLLRLWSQKKAIFKSFME